MFASYLNKYTGGHESSCSYARMRYIKENRRVSLFSLYCQFFFDKNSINRVNVITRKFIKSAYPDSSSRVFCVRNAIYFRLVKSGRTPPRERTAVSRFSDCTCSLRVICYRSRTLQIDRNVRSDLERLAPW